MALYKCKMCGGELALVPDSSVCTCEYCGTRQTVPSADNEKKLTLFARASRTLRACEFDRAAGVFEAIVADFPNEAEAYWGLVLCKYGIEYVDDPATGRKIPTCHRSSFDCVTDDANYQQAIAHADVVARELYLAEAKQLEEIRKGIIELSAKSEPYDIFICYKEADENEERTLDSVIAQDVYDALTEQGYRVFFSRVSLEDKLGTEYEPYIFAALNSAKIMLAFGTREEYYDSVWVRNEWSRFLKLIADGQKKTLIPCYKGIDPYDLPKDFARLQAQDMGKVGAIQDLLHGVEKILPRGGRKTASAAPIANKKTALLLGGAVAVLVVAALLIGMSLGARNEAKSGSALDEIAKSNVQPITVEFPQNSDPDYARNGEIINIDVPIGATVGPNYVKECMDEDITTSCFSVVPENLGTDLDAYIVNSSSYEYLESTNFKDGVSGSGKGFQYENVNYCLLVWKWDRGPYLIGYFVGVPEQLDKNTYRFPVTLCHYDVTNLRERMGTPGKS